MCEENIVGQKYMVDQKYYGWPKILTWSKHTWVFGDYMVVWKKWSGPSIIRWATHAHRCSPERRSYRWASATWSDREGKVVVGHVNRSQVAATSTKSVQCAKNQVCWLDGWLLLLLLKLPPPLLLLLLLLQLFVVVGSRPLLCCFAVHTFLAIFRCSIRGKLPRRLILFASAV